MSASARVSSNGSKSGKSKSDKSKSPSPVSSKVDREPSKSYKSPKSMSGVAKKSSKAPLRAEPGSLVKMVKGIVKAHHRISIGARRRQVSLAALPRFLRKVHRLNAPQVRSDGTDVTPIPRAHINRVISDVLCDHGGGICMTKEARSVLSEAAQNELTSVFNQSQVYACHRHPKAVLPAVTTTDMMLALDSCGSKWSKAAMATVIAQRDEAGLPIGRISSFNGRFVPRASYVPMTESMAARMASLTDVRSCVSRKRKGASPVRAVSTVTAQE